MYISPIYPIFYQQNIVYRRVFTNFLDHLGVHIPKFNTTFAFRQTFTTSFLCISSEETLLGKHFQLQHSPVLSFILWPFTAQWKVAHILTQKIQELHHFLQIEHILKAILFQTRFCYPFIKHHILTIILTTEFY